MNTITLTPAFGRDYKSKAAVLADWDANKDFMVNHISHSGYVNKTQVRDLKHDGFTAITFRFARCTKGFIINI